MNKIRIEFLSIVVSKKISDFVNYKLDSIGSQLTMSIRVMKFSNGGYKIRKVFA